MVPTTSFSRPCRVIKARYAVCVYIFMIEAYSILHNKIIFPSLIIDYYFGCYHFRDQTFPADGERARRGLGADQVRGETR